MPKHWGVGKRQGLTGSMQIARSTDLAICRSGWTAKEARKESVVKSLSTVLLGSVLFCI